MNRDTRLGLPRALTASALLVTAALLVLVVGKGVWPALETAGGDFAKYYAASRIALDGEAFENAYLDFVWFQKRMEMAGVEGQVGGFIPHPPATALAMLPLVWLEPLPAKRLWTLINVALAALCVWLLARTAALNPAVAAALFLGTGFGLVNNLVLGQLYLFLLASLLAGIALGTRHPFLAGICFGVLGPMKYVGGLYLFQAAHEKKWRIVLGGAFSASLVMAATLWLTGTEPLEVFFRSVLGRHLEGAIQDPFASRFQSWNSLLRRLFVGDPILNPHPAIDSPPMFFAVRNLVLCGGLALWLRTYLINNLSDGCNKTLFRAGWIAVGVLLLSPAGATYHFLLLTLPAVFFVALSLRRGAYLAAAAFAALHLAINFPHYLYLESWTEGWWNPLGYSRLLLLCLFFALGVWSFGGKISRTSALRWSGAALALAAAATVGGSFLASRSAGDPARRLSAPGGDAPLRILAEPSIGSRLLLSYCLDLVPDATAGICDREGRELAPTREKNWYGVRVAGDDSRILAETVQNGSPQIWSWRLGDKEARWIAEGEDASWSPDLASFAYVNRGRIRVKNLESDRETTIGRLEGVAGLDWSPSGNHLAVAARVRAGDALMIVDLDTGDSSILLRDDGTIGSPRWSPSGQWLLFSWRRGGNRDIWAMRADGSERRRLTMDPADDDHPAWDASTGSVIFASDRGRGLGFPTLFWLPLPSGLR